MPRIGKGGDDLLGSEFTLVARSSLHARGAPLSFASVFLSCVRIKLPLQQRLRRLSYFGQPAVFGRNLSWGVDFYWTVPELEGSSAHTVAQDLDNRAITSLNWLRRAGFSQAH